MTSLRPATTAEMAEQVPALRLTEGQRRSNEQAAAIAAREVYAHWLRTGSVDHLNAYEAWRAGERSWPWPDAAIAEARTDAAFRDLIAPLIKGHRAFERGR